MKQLKKFEVKLYLEGWVDHVGFDFSPEMTLLNAMADRPSLVHWFGTADVDYDEDSTLELMRAMWEKYNV